MSARTASALIAFLALAAAGCGARPGPPPPVSDTPPPVIDAEELAGPIRILSSDRFEGRGPGSRGDELTRRYIENEMRALGLQPAMPDGSWEQPFELLGITSKSPPAWEFRADGGRLLRLIRSQDFVAVSTRNQKRVELSDAEIVFVGYGIDAPEYQWDDYKGVDVRGKVVLVLNNDPDWDPTLFAGKRRLYYGRWTYKYENAARHGAAGVLLLHTTESAAYPWQTVQTSWSGENSRLPQTAPAELTVQSWISEASARALVQLGGHDLDQVVASARRRDFTPVPLGIRTSIVIDNELRSYRSANVIGRIAGEGSELADQAIVYTAHHDHLGIKADGDGQPVIYNGAVDNAAGIAQMLAVARAFRRLQAAGDRPQRSIVFAALAAEEQGLLGSEFFVRNPILPPARMVAAINFDGGNIWGRTRDVAVTGYGKSSLDRWVTAAAARQGRKVTDERFPERGSFYRSDQFNFARVGVPVLYAHSGLDFIGRPEGWGREMEDAWIARHYHQPSDDFGADWNFDGMIEDAQLAFDVGRALAFSADQPKWNAGDEFEAVRLESEKSLR